MMRAIYSKLRNMGSGLSVVNISKTIRNTMVLSAFFILFFLPTVAEASIISFIASFFTGETVEAEETSPNLQNMPLLEARISPSGEATSTGEDLSIVGGTSLSPETQAVSTDSRSFEDEQISIYVVHQGDTLPAIAKMFGVSVNTIRWANDLNGNTIKVGQTLVILPISGIKHVVKSGDTLQSIAKQHKGDLDEILQYNNLSKNSKLSVGDIIVVPDGEAVATPSYSTGSSIIRGSSRPVYDGYYMRPIIGGIKTQGIHGHNGVDLASVYGANILSSADGDVIISRTGWNGGYGTYIVIKHSNGTQTLYGHLSSLLVSSGDHVSQGQVIGRMGSTGKSTGVHLHFEIRGARNPF